MSTNEVYNVYLLNNPNTIIRYTIIRTNGNLKLKKKIKETYPSISDTIQRVLELEDNGHFPINILLSILNKKQIIKLFGEKNSESILSSKTLKLIY